MGINVTDPDKYYKEFEKQRQEDHEIHDRLASKINDILRSEDSSRYEEIGKILESEDYTRAVQYFNDLKDFYTSFVVYSTEAHAGVTRTIYDIAASIEDYLAIRLSLLYCFRRIQLLQTLDEISDAYLEFMDRGLSPLFILGMLKELEVGDRGYVGRYMAELLSGSGREKEGLLLQGLVSQVYPAADSTVEIDRITEASGHYNKKICFITCVNNDRMYRECLFYINNLIVPEGTTVDTISIREADSMTSGYNAAMEASDADIKVYLHQDVCVINPYFLIDIMDIFDADPDIGILGIIGSPKLPEDAVMWHGPRVGKLYHDDRKIEYRRDPKSRYSKVEYMEAVDGLLIATSKDVRWREDLFDGWDFYDVSECAEHRRQGYKVVVADPNSSWVIHDDGLMNLYNYGKYRKVFIQEYLSGRGKEQ